MLFVLLLLSPPPHTQNPTHFHIFTHILVTRVSLQAILHTEKHSWKLRPVVLMIEVFQRLLTAQERGNGFSENAATDGEWVVESPLGETTAGLAAAAAAAKIERKLLSSLSPPLSLSPLQWCCSSGLKKNVEERRRKRDIFTSLWIVAVGRGGRGRRNSSRSGASFWVCKKKTTAAEKKRKKKNGQELSASLIIHTSHTHPHTQTNTDKHYIFSEYYPKVVA